MLNAIRGSIIEINDSDIVVLTDSGIEFTLFVSLNTRKKFLELSPEERKNTRVFSVLVHREDVMLLYGFYDNKERFCFNELQTVPGIGAKGALKILGGITVDELAEALDAQDVKKLSKVPGLGSKTAQKVILQLRNVLVFNEEEPEKKENSTIASKYKDLIFSFTEMGYDRKTVVKAIGDCLENSEELIKDKSDREVEKLLFNLVLRRIN